jgi:hypothetical protein
MNTMDYRAAVPSMDQRQSSVGCAGAEGLTALSAGLARVLADEHPNSNIVFSPLFIYTALALVAATLEEILRVLGVQFRCELDKFVAAVVDACALRDRSGSGGGPARGVRVRAR